MMTTAVFNDKQYFHTFVEVPGTPAQISRLRKLNMLQVDAIATLQPIQIQKSDRSEQCFQCLLFKICQKLPKMKIICTVLASPFCVCSDAVLITGYQSFFFLSFLNTQILSAHRISSQFILYLLNAESFICRYKLPAVTQMLEIFTQTPAQKETCLVTHETLWEMKE